MSEFDVIERWIDRHRRDLGRLQETDDFERGFRAALDLLADLATRRRQRAAMEPLTIRRCQSTHTGPECDGPCQYADSPTHPGTPT